MPLLGFICHSFSLQPVYLMVELFLQAQEVHYLLLWRHISLFQLIRDMALRGGADKSLVRPGRKQSTATKLRIYSTYFPQSSIHFLAQCSNFCKPPKKKKKNIRWLSIQPCLRGSKHLRVRRKMAAFQLFFQSWEQVVARGQIWRIGWVIKTFNCTSRDK